MKSVGFMLKGVKERGRERPVPVCLMATAERTALHIESQRSGIIGAVGESRGLEISLAQDQFRLLVFSRGPAPMYHGIGKIKDGMLPKPGTCWHQYYYCANFLTIVPIRVGRLSQYDFRSCQIRTAELIRSDRAEDS